MEIITLSRVAARRFILGKQGLWPGRRWSGKRGTERAMRAMEHLQLDPLQIAARSQDIALHSRVAGYTPGLWEELCYRDRKFFDWGGWLAVRPLEELPHWRAVMRRERETPRWRSFARKHRAAIEEMRAAVRSKGTVSNRDFAMHTRRRVDDYRGRKDSSVALYYLWRTGELMTHRRDRFERVYALADAVAPAHLLCESSDSEADVFLIRKTIAFHGLHRMSAFGNMLGRRITAREAARVRDKLLSDGEIIAVQIEGWKDVHYALADDARILRTINAGRIPAQWRPCQTTTREEVSFISPLDIVMSRSRARLLFDFDYVWEVYKPLHQRKWGYYTLPILWDENFVGRIDPKLDRTSNTLVVNGFWLENAGTAKDPAFAEALAAGLVSFMRLVGATSLDAGAITRRGLRTLLTSIGR